MTNSLRLTVAAGAATFLSSLCLSAVFQAGGWVLPVFAAVCVAAAAAETARRLDVARSLVAPLSLLAVLALLVLQYARPAAILGLVPSPDAIGRLVDLALQGRREITGYAAPVGPLPGIMFLTTAGVGLTAIVVDAMAVTYRRPALAGLGLLVLYTVPVALAPDGVGWATFAIGAGGWLALLLTASAERLSHWGQPLRASAARNSPGTLPVDATPLAALGRRVGAAALGLAVVVPVVAPGLDQSLLSGGGTGFGRGRGSSTVSVINPILTLGDDLTRDTNRDVLSYRGDPTYLRMVSLDVFTGERWEPSRLKVSRDQRVDRGLPAPRGLGSEIPRTKVRHQIRVLDLEQRWLPLPYPATRVDIRSRWLYDAATFNVFSTDATTRRQDYDVESLAVAPTPEHLRNAGQAPPELSRFKTLPPNLPDTVRVAASRVTDGAHTSYDKAVALQDWLRSGAFTYSEDAPGGTGSDSIADFLEQRSGYCVHFASTMAVMARALGIPARVDVGFTTGRKDSGGNWVVRLHDAHAWPELFFQGVGWLAFEPTPAVRTGAPPAYARAQPTEAPGATASASATTSAGAVPTSTPGRPERDESVNASAGGQPLYRRLTLPLVPTLLLLAGLVLLAAPAAVRAVTRRRRWRGARDPAALAHAGWEELAESARDLRYGWVASETPRRTAGRLRREAGLDGDVGQALDRLASATEQARYARSVALAADPRADVALVRSGLAAAVSRWVRWRSRVAPPSSRRVLTFAGERVADGLDALDEGLGRAKSRLTPRRRPAR